MASPASSTSTGASTESDIETRVRTEIERAISRNIKGLEYLSTGDPQVGLTPKDVLLSRGTMKLYHYRPLSTEVYRTPVLLVMSLVSKPYILDLTPGQSFVEYLLKEGYDVFMIDWGVPRPEDRRLRLEDYLFDLIPQCVQAVLDDTGEEDISMIGYCMGGLFASMYAALYPDGPLRNLACFTTPVDFNGMGLFRRWTDRKHFDVDHVVDSLGNVPPELLFASFEMLRPSSRVASQVRLWDNMWNDDFVRSFRMVDRWAADQIPFPGECFRQVIKDLMWDNRLMEGTFELAGKPVRLEDIRVPLVHVVGEHDHIVPYDSAKPLVPNAGSEEKHEIILKGGHVSLVAGGNAMYRLWPQVNNWLAGRSE